MPASVTFVVAIGRMSAGDLVARPVIEQVVGKYGGQVRAGGAGSSADPIVADFADSGSAQQAAKELWYHDSVETATVHDLDNLATSTIRENVAAGNLDPVEAALSGLSVSETVDAMLEAAKAGKSFLNESCNEDPAELPKISELADELDEIVEKFSGLANVTASTFVEDAKAASDALRKIVASYPQA
jgi:hypothetical protein